MKRTISILILILTALGLAGCNPALRNWKPVSNYQVVRQPTHCNIPVGGTVKYDARIYVPGEAPIRVHSTLSY